MAAWTVLCNGVVLGEGGFDTLLMLAPVALLAGFGAWWWSGRRCDPETLHLDPTPRDIPARARPWRLALAVAVTALHHASSSAGEVVAQSRSQGLESDAYFYTEVSAVRAFLDDQGRYGAAAPAQSTGDD